MTGLYAYRYFRAGGVALMQVVFSIPGAGADPAQIESAEEQAERFVGDRCRRFVGIPLPVEPTFFQTLRTDPESGSIPDEELDPVAGAVAEDEDVTAHGILVELVGDDAVESVEAFTHVGGSGDDEDAGGGTQGDHGRVCSR